MLSGLRCRAPRWRRAPHRADDGFALIEVLVAMALIGIVMSALTTFFLSALAITDQQGDRQTAVQLATDGADLAGRTSAGTLLAGRGECAGTNCAEPVLGAVELLDGTHPVDHHTERWDAAVGGTPAPTLPLAPVVVRLNGIDYLQHWYVGKCWQPVAGGTCNVQGPRRATAHYLEFFRIVVAVTWPERGCPDNTCSYATGILVDTHADDPVFKADDTATSPVPGSTDNQVGYRGTRITTLVFDSIGGMAPFSWAFTGLPAGLYGNATGEVSGIPTAVGVFDVTATVTGYNNKAGSARFQWKILEPLRVTAPGDQSGVSGDEVSLQVRTAGGTAPLGFAATGLPSGLVIDVDTGVISGRPETAQPPTPVTVTVTDAAGQSSSTTFTWAVTDPAPLPEETEPAPAPTSEPAPLVITDPGEQTSVRDIAIEARQVASASGGSPGYQWSASGLPAGLSIDAQSGVVTGTPTTQGDADVQIRVRDAAGAEVATEQFRWRVEKK